MDWKFEQFQQISDKTVGTAVVAASSGSMFIQWMTNFGSLVLILLNILLACGGLYLLFFRIIKAHKEAKAKEKKLK